MNFNRLIRSGAILATLTFAMTQFQNCGPANISDTDVSAVDGEVRIVDQWNTQKVLFARPEMAVAAQDENLIVAGWCDRSNYDQAIEWQLLNLSDNEQMVAQGESLCERGGFAVELDNIQGLSCGKDYLLQAAGLEGQAETVLRRGCEDFKTAQAE